MRFVRFGIDGWGHGVIDTLEEGAARTARMIRRAFGPTVPRWLVAASIVAIAVWFSSAPLAGAHAVLESSTPADQSVSATSPPKVSLTFGEAVAITASSIRVFDGDGKRVDQGVTRHGDVSTVVDIGLKPDLPVGSYVVTWHVVSADSHPVHGGFVFSVGRAGRVGNVDQLLHPSSQPGWEAVGDGLRGIGYLAAFIVVGGVLFLSYADTGLDRRRRAAGPLAAVGIVAVLAAVAQIPVQAILAADLGPGSLFETGVAAQVLGDGVVVTLLGVALAVLVSMTVRWAKSVEHVRAIAVVSVVLLAGAFVVSGHTRSTNPEWLVSLVDAIHVVAGVIWVGGLVMLLWVLRDRRGSTANGVPADPVDAAGVVVRFSHLATGGVVAVGVSGIVLAWFEVGSWNGLFSTGYGRLVLAKVALLAVLAGLGAFNHFRLVPAVEAAPDRRAGWARLGRTMRFEAIAMVAILGVTGVLVNAIPARTVEARRVIASSTAPLGSGTVNLVIDPARTGPTALHLYLLDARGRPDDRVQSVDVQLRQPALGIGPIERMLQKAGPGHYVLNATLFTVPGTWTVTAEVRVDEFTENAATIRVKIRG